MSFIYATLSFGFMLGLFIAGPDKHVTVTLCATFFLASLIEGAKEKLK